MNSKIDRDKKVVKLMIELYCKHKLGVHQIPEKYLRLIQYANFKLEHCSWGKNKPACKDCPHHCYSLEKRKEIQEIMRWTGPRMLIWCPCAAFHHLFQVYQDKALNIFSYHKKRHS